MNYLFKCYLTQVIANRALRSIELILYAKQSGAPTIIDYIDKASCKHFFSILVACYFLKLVERRRVPLKLCLCSLDFVGIEILRC